MKNGHKTRLAIRMGEYSGPTGFVAHEFSQVNLAIIPDRYAADFEAFIKENPYVFPLMSIGKKGDPSLPDLGVDIDIRTDLPKYRIFSNGVAVETRADIKDLWRSDFVSFAIGCSLSFEADLAAEGVKLRSYENGVTCSAFDTNIPLTPVGVFGGNMVASMRAVKSKDVDHVVELTSKRLDAHGPPIHIGLPSEIGVDLSKPIDNIGLTNIENGEVPVFWACGVSLERAISYAMLDIAITHAPGHMLITDIPAHK